jgi:hypothetical protein
MTAAVIGKTIVPTMPSVFLRQYLGSAHQPPVGDQTHFGYLQHHSTSHAIVRHTDIEVHLVLPNCFHRRPSKSIIKDEDPSNNNDVPFFLS